jgi:hypothetical protein
MSDSQFEEYLDEQTKSPACGSCILLADHLRADAAVIYRTQAGQVYPPKPVDAWRELTDTRWAQKINLQEFLANPKLDEQLRYDHITESIAPNRLAEWVAAEEETAEAARAELAQWRAQARSAEPNSET